jgi:lipoyl(octanoyl) transferase
VKPARFVELGRTGYEEAWRLQLRLVEERQADRAPDTLLFVEHPDVITLGRRQSARDHVIDGEAMPIFEVERGGDATYHGPGQLVGYPILKLDEQERDLHAYLRALEEALIATCADFGVRAERNPGLTGVWTSGRKLASIGIAVRRWVTLHGFALNVSTDLTRFAAIHPCGLDAQVMTSLAREAGRALTLAEVAPRAVMHLGEALGRAFAPAALEE